MALTYGFFNSLNGDRKYNAEQFGSIFDGIISDGIFQVLDSALAITPYSGMNIMVGAGRAWFNHTWTLCDSMQLTVPTSEVVLNRWDAVILEVDSNIAVRANSIKILKGTPATTPVKPALTISGLLNQYVLAYIYVPAGKASIEAGDITDMRGQTGGAPYSYGILATAQGNLQTQLTTLKASYDSHAANKSNPHTVTSTQVGLGNVPNVTTNGQTPTFTIATSDVNLSSGETWTVSLGKIARAVATHIAHLANKSNPHGVTATQLNLGNVPNVTTNNQTPTWTISATLASLSSGEALTDAFGKIARAINSLSTHMSSTANPHSTTASQVGLGNVPNVSTNSQTPTYSMAASNSTLSSGETLATAFGKLSKIVSSVINHMSVDPSMGYVHGIQSGTATMTLAANVVGSVKVTFPVAYASGTPSIFVTANSSGPGTAFEAISVSDTSSTGFTIYARRTNASQMTVYWMAMPG